MVKIKSIATYAAGLCLVFLLTNFTPKSDNTTCEKDRLSRSERAKYIKNAQSKYRYTNIDNDKLVFGINYHGMDTVLRCIHRMEVCDNEGRLRQHAFAVLNNKELFISPDQKFESLDWLSGLPSLVVDKDTFEIMFLEAYDTMSPTAFSANPNFIPTVNQNYGIEYVKVKYYDRSKEIMELNLGDGTKYIRYQGESRKLLMYFIVMIDMNREAVLNSSTCKWEKIEILDLADSVHSTTP